MNPLKRKGRLRKLAWSLLNLCPLGRSRRNANANATTAPDPSLVIEAPARIGVILQWGIGDAVLAIPLLSALRKRYPSASIELIGKPWLSDLFKATGWCDRAHHLVPPWTNYSGKYRIWKPEWRRFARQFRNVRRERFDWLIGIRHDPREVLQIRLMNAASKIGFGGGSAVGLDLDLGLPPHRKDDTHVSRDAAVAGAALTGQPPEGMPTFQVSSEASRRVLAQFKEQGYRAGLIVAISHSAGHPIRRWEPTRFEAVLAKLPAQVGFLVLIAEPGDAIPYTPPSHIPSIHWQSSLSELRAMFSVADLVLATDSGMMHVASACGCRVVAIFGPQRPTWFGPYSEEDRTILVEPMPCRPCFDACIYSKPICMIGVTSDAVSDAVHESLRQQGKSKAEIFSDHAGTTPTSDSIKVSEQ